MNQGDKIEKLFIALNKLAQDQSLTSYINIQMLCFGDTTAEPAQHTKYGVPTPVLLLNPWA